MSDGDKGGGGGSNSNAPNNSDMMNQVTQGQVMLSQQNMASIQHQQALQMQQQAAAAQQQAGMEAAIQQQTSQAQTVNQTQALLVNSANLHQQLQNSSSGGNNQGGMGSQAVSQGGGTSMCIQQGIQSMASSPSLHQQQQIGSISLQGTNVGGNQSGSTTITTMSTLPQQAQTAAPQQLQQVQVIQQPMQNAYVQQVYNAQGQMLMSALHPNMNPGSIQVIAAGKPFQSNQLTSHVLSKPVLTAANAQQGSFPGYATIPTTTNQTLVITGGQLGVISGQLPQSQPKPQDLQKAGGGGNSGQVKTGGGGNQSNQQVIAQNCVASHPMLHHLISPIQYTTCGNGRQGGVGSQTQAQAVQIASPWQFPQLPQVWATQSPHPQVIQNPIFIRGPQQDQPQMFIHQSPPPSQSLQQQQQQQNVGVAKQEMKAGGSPQVSRTLSILPSTSMAPPIRPATSASTQIVKSQQIKMRTKAILTKSNIPPQKDAQNQTKPGMQTTTSPQLPHQIIPATKMIITSQGTIVQGPIDNKVVGQVTNQQQAGTAVAMPQQTAVAMSQGAVTMQQGAVTMQQAVVHQPQLIQPKPPPLMSLSMPSLEPLPSSAEKQMDSVPSMEIVPGTLTSSLPVPNSEQAQDRLTEQPVQGDDSSSNAIQPSMSQENGQSSEESKVPEPMEVVEPDPTPPLQIQQSPISTAPLTNGISTGTVGLSLPSSLPPTSVSHTATIGNATAVRSSSPAVTNTVLPTSQLNGQQAQSLDETKERRTPKAMVKPHSQVLTHIIEGYVIQESSEPFPINRTNLLNDLSQQTKADIQNLDSSNEPPVKKQSLDLSGMDDAGVGPDKLKCETCGKIDLKEKFKKKRFCSTQCARRGSSSGRKRSKSKDEDTKTVKEWVEEGEQPSGISGAESNSDSSNEPLSNPLKWTVAEVCEFIKNLPGCKEYAEDFAIQEIDGQALILLKPDHLMSAMSMKLGPALKICAKIDTMRTDNQTPGQTTPV